MSKIKLDIDESFYNEEIRCGYVISRKMKKVWAVELDLLNELLRVCEKYNIEIFAFAGTMLGAVRHHGMIPWDNDIDLMMTRKNYNKLCDISKKEFLYPYFFQIEDTDNGSMRGHAQLRNSETTAILKAELDSNVKFNQGIFIDIFPMDGIPSNKKIWWIKYVWWLKSNYERVSLLTSRYKKENGMKGNIKRILHLLIYPLDKLFKIDKLFYKKFENEISRYSSRKTKELAPLMLRNERFIVKCRQLSKSIKMPFEMTEIPVPAKYNDILNQTYGDWHKYVVGKSVHGDLILDPDKPYTEYLR